jgi:ankyrin repeat protein
VKGDPGLGQFLASGREQRVVQLIDAVCGRGWDAPSTADVERAETYLKADPSLCAQDFALACACGEVELVRARLGADPGLVTRELGPRAWQPLVYVAYSVLARRHDARAERITEVGRLLMERGASANSSYSAPGGDGKRHSFPVLFGCIHVSDNLSLAERLLDAGADANDNQSLYHAVERFSLDALELLYRYGLKPEWLSYCMLHQIDLGYLAGVRWFLDHGADPNIRHPWGLSALHWAIQRPGTSAIIELLLERGADAQAKTLGFCGDTSQPGGCSALDLAERWHGKVEAVPALERGGATRGERAPLDQLIVAAAYGDEARAQALLEADPELLAQAAHRDRARVAAFAEAGNHQGAVILAKLGFDLQTPSWMGMTALHWAACRGNPQLLLQLLELGAPMIDVPGFGTPLHTALYQRWSSFGCRPGESDYLGVLRVLLAAGVEVPNDLRPCGDAELDALLESARTRTS